MSTRRHPIQRSLLTVILWCVVLLLPGILTAQDDHDGPSILVISPQDGAVLASPVAVDIRFVPQSDSQIDTASLRVTVEKLWPVDITDRVKPYLSGNSISIAGADIPKGEHTINISIADQDGRTSSRTVSVAVR
jgi:hypothetical protein